MREINFRAIPLFGESFVFGSLIIEPNERKNTYVEGLLIGIDEELNLCTIRTKDDYIGGEICYLDTLSINFPDMMDSQGNKIFASLQEDGRGGSV